MTQILQTDGTRCKTMFPVGSELFVINLKISYHQDLFATNTIMLDGLEIGLDRRLDDELGW
jgi:hypothetical protein